MIILIGPSASGKTEIAKKLISTFGYKKFVTTTTRNKRVAEIDGIDYYFISVDKFKENLANNKFIETTIYNNNYYGSYKSEMGDNKVLIVEPNGLKAFQSLNDSHIISFFIDSSEEDRYERMIKRGDEINDIKRRLHNDCKLFYENIKTDFRIINKNKSLEELSIDINNLYLKKIKSL